ncbi:MAG: flagellar filament capping protein FliD [Lachnospiraceae bacterium]|nr:flagellar filament capping protein FliD [Ruminococcus sp.]MCM1274510.1 flagellar filament capping protein FliD [Lachnospiraceae bacterium]
MASDIMRLSGINSGYDSEAMIEQMMSSYQTKIDNQNKKLTKLTWQQEAYRDITAKLTAFQNKYFDILKKDSYLMSPTAFSKFNTTITNKTEAGKDTGLKVSTTSSAVEGTHKLNVARTATASTRTGSVLGTQNFNIDLEKALNTSEYTENDDGSRTYSFALDVKVGDVSKTLEFTADVTPAADGSISAEALAQAKSDVIADVNQQLKDYFGETDKGSGNYFLQAKDNGDGVIGFSVNGNSAVTITEKSGNFGLARPQTRISIAAQSAVTGENSITVDVGGVVKEVKFDAVSDTYYDSRNEAGNEKILAEYNQLKRAAYIKDKKAIPTEEQLEEYTYTSTQAAKDKNTAAIRSAMNSAFKSEGIQFDITGTYVTATKGGEVQRFSLTATKGGTFGLEKGTVSNKFTDKTELYNLGLAPNSSDKDGNAQYSLTINGKEITVDKNATIADLVSAVNKSDAGVTMTYSKLENRFIITANDLGNGGDVDIDESDAFAQALGLTASAGGTYELGENAKFTIDGVEIYHNANTYTMDGITFDFSEVTTDTDITVGVSKSYDDIKQTIKDFVNDYNQLIDDVYAHIGTSPKRDSKNNTYEPLTDAEKEDMSEDEIEKWEKAAKTGVIYNDSTVSGIMSKLRIAIYNSVTLDDGSSFGLFNMGIKVKSALDDSEAAKHGKLEIDEDAFDKAFETNPDAIVKLFTDPDKGVMKQIDNIIDDAVSTSKISSSTVRGSLIRKAGLESGSTAKNNAIYRQMEQINKRISQLQDRYDAKEDYWWSVFTNLEKMMSDMNSQSNYLASYLGSYGTTG